MRWTLRRLWTHKRNAFNRKLRPLKERIEADIQPSQDDELVEQTYHMSRDRT
jgi:hypothetical protein